jgi:hypothetical protein
MVDQIIRERGGGATVAAAGDVAPLVVAAAEDLPARVGTGGADAVEPLELVRMAAVTVEIAVLRAAAIDRSLPQLAQVRVDKAVAIGGDMARRVAGVAVALPYEALLLLALSGRWTEARNMTRTEILKS